MKKEILLMIMVSLAGNVQAGCYIKNGTEWETGTLYWSFEANIEGYVNYTMTELVNVSTWDDGSYIECCDVIDKADNSIWECATFVVDNTNPLWTLRVPAEDNSTRTANGFNLDIDVYDDHLYSLAFNTTNASGTVMYFNSSINVSGTTFYIRDLINTTNWSDGIYTFRGLAKDGHHYKAFDAVSIKEKSCGKNCNKKWLEFENRTRYKKFSPSALGGQDIRKLKSPSFTAHPLSDKDAIGPGVTIENEYGDRLGFVPVESDLKIDGDAKATLLMDALKVMYEFKNPSKKDPPYKTVFKIISNREIFFRPESKYAGHFISGDNFLEFEQEKRAGNEIRAFQKKGEWFVEVRHSLEPSSFERS